ncbi:MAG: hypothetical protein ABEJ24_05610 [Candidatus Magasanikbacteria bacterium]
MTPGSPEGGPNRSPTEPDEGQVGGQDDSETDISQPQPDRSEVDGTSEDGSSNCQCGRKYGHDPHCPAREKDLKKNEVKRVRERGKRSIAENMANELVESQWDEKNEDFKQDMKDILTDHLVSYRSWGNGEIDPKNVEDFSSESDLDSILEEYAGDIENWEDIIQKFSEESEASLTPLTIEDLLSEDYFGGFELVTDLKTDVDFDDFDPKDELNGVDFYLTTKGLVNFEDKSRLYARTDEGLYRITVKKDKDQLEVKKFADKLESVDPPVEATYKNTAKYTE